MKPISKPQGKGTQGKMVGVMPMKGSMNDMTKAADKCSGACKKGGM